MNNAMPAEAFRINYALSLVDALRPAAERRDLHASRDETSLTACASE